MLDAPPQTALYEVEDRAARRAAEARAEASAARRDAEVETAVDGVAGRLHALARGAPGELQRLRRLDLDAPDGVAFWQALEAHVPEALRDRQGRLKAWAAALKGMAYMAPGHHAKHRSLGKALQQANYTETRFAHLKHCAPDRRPEAVVRLARLLLHKGLSFNWNDIVPALLFPEEAPERFAVIARDYYAEAGFEFDGGFWDDGFDDVDDVDGPLVESLLTGDDA